MVQVDAMKCGIPVVASNLPGVRVPVRLTGMGIVVEPQDEKLLAEAIKHILKNHSLYDSQEMLQKVMVTFSYNTSIDAIRGVILQSLSGVKK